MTRKKFDIKEFVEKTHTIESEKFGDITYADLTLNDSQEINAIEDNTERGLQMVVKMLNKAGNTVTVEELKAMPIKDANKLIELLAKEAGFLPQGKDEKKSSKT